MPDPVGLNGLLPGRGPGLGATGRGAAPAPAPPPGAAGLALRGIAEGATPLPPARPAPALPGSPAAPGPGCVNGTCGTPGRPGPSGVADWPSSARSSAPGRDAAGLTSGCPTTAGGPAAAASAIPALARSALTPPSTPGWPAPSAAAFAAAAALAAAAWPANASLSLRTTGASIVDDGERTNSPISWSLAMTALLSTPNSLASSYTRTFATTLPASARDVRATQPARGCACSGPALAPAVHRRMLIERSS